MVFSRALQSASTSPVAVDLLRSENADSTWLSFEFWLNEQALRRAKNLAARAMFDAKLPDICDSIFDVGAFSFPPRLGVAERLCAVEIPRTAQR
jgi:hypothetical protein